jgi:eukaryotic-like serine/threonine-protein kinase
MALATGTRLGRYEIAGLLGEGGMGEVYRARDTRLDRDVAVKVVRAATNDAVARLEREARAVASLDHPNILSIFDVGTAEDGSTYLVTELLDGQTLRDRLAKAPPGMADAVRIVRLVAEALHAAHVKGVVHRDVKPDNVFLTPDGRVKVLDFGIAQLRSRTSPAAPGEAPDETLTAAALTDEGHVPGTPGYTSPEQLRGGRVDARSDVFALGILLHETLTGRSPFRRDTPADTMAAILSDEAAPLDLGTVLPSVARIVQECLRKRPEDRYQSAHDVALALDGAMSDTPTGRRARGEAPATARRRVSRGWVAVGIAACVVIAGAVTYRLLGPRPVPLTDKDTIVVAHLENRTGEPIFDDTLRESLLVALRQSPFLDIVPDARVGEVLGLMRRQAGTRLTTNLAREVATRAAAKAVIGGSIAPLGGRYVLTLQALAAENGAVIADAQAEADRREDVLRALGDAARDLRRPLGESLKSIERYDKPLPEATTASLEAWKAYTQSAALTGEGKRDEALSAAKRAVQIDPTFAEGWRQLYVAALNLDLVAEGAQYAAKAFLLRDRVTERERYALADGYYSDVTGELDKEIANADQWVQAYPRDGRGWAALAIGLATACRTEDAISACRRGLGLTEAMALRTNLANYLIDVRRLPEAEEMVAELRRRYPEARTAYTASMRLAALQGDPTQVDAILRRSEGKAWELNLLTQRAGLAAGEGRLSAARELSARYAAKAAAKGLEELVNDERIERAFIDSLAGDCGAAARLRSSPLLADSLLVVGGGELGAAAGVALARCGFLQEALRVSARLRTERPLAAGAKAGAAVVEAAVAIGQSRSRAAIDRLENVRQFDACDPTIRYLRGLAYRRLGQEANAVGEFEKVEPGPGLLPRLIRLELARALVASGNAVKSRETYEEVFAQWKDADADFQPLKAARAEYAMLH